MLAHVNVVRVLEYEYFIVNYKSVNLHISTDWLILHETCTRISNERSIQQSRLKSVVDVCYKKTGATRRVHAVFFCVDL